MSVTKEDLRDFNRFAAERLANGGADSLVALAGEWEAERPEVTNEGTGVPPMNVEVDEHTLRTLATAFPDVEDVEMLSRAHSRRGGLTTAQMLAKAVALAKKAGQE